MRSTAATPRQYLDGLPPAQKAALSKLRSVIKRNLPAGFSETMANGSIAIVVPLSKYPAGYHAASKTPLPFINLAAQKSYLAVYHMGLYDAARRARFEKAWRKSTPAKLDCGKSCIRIRDLEQIPFEAFGELARELSPERWIEVYEKSRR